MKICRRNFALGKSGVKLTDNKQTISRQWVYPYPRVSDFAGRNSDNSPSETQTKTQTTPDSAYAKERKNSDHGLSFWKGKLRPWSEFRSPKG